METSSVAERRGEHVRRPEMAFGVRRPKEFAHFDGSGGAILFALPAEACASEPACGWRELTTGDAEKHTGEGFVDLVSVSPASNIEQVCDVLCTRDSGAWSCKSRISQSCEGATEPTAWVASLRLVVRANVHPQRIFPKSGLQLVKN